LRGRPSGTAPLRRAAHSSMRSLAVSCSLPLATPAPLQHHCSPTPKLIGCTLSPTTANARFCWELLSVLVVHLDERLGMRSLTGQQDTLAGCDGCQNLASADSGRAGWASNDQGSHAMCTILYQKRTWVLWRPEKNI
jgi:hypothetical protein